MHSHHIPRHICLADFPRLSQSHHAHSIGNVAANIAHFDRSRYAHSWKYQHKSETNRSLTIATLNVRGLSSVVERKQICDLSLDAWDHRNAFVLQNVGGMFSQYHCVYAPDGADRQFPPFGKSYHESRIMMMHASKSIKPVGQSPNKLGWGPAVPSLSFMLPTDLVSQDGRTINVPI